MEFIQKLSYKHLVFFYFVFLFFNSNFILAKDDEGIPYIQQIGIKNFNYKDKNFSVIQNKNGILYIGYRNGIIEYDGTYVEYIPFRGIPHFALKNDTIFVSGYNDFGILAPGPDNKTIFCSLLDKNLDFKQIEQVVAFNNTIFLCSSKILLQWGGGHLSVIDSSCVQKKIFNLSKELFLFSQDKGLLRYQGTSFVPFFNNALLQGGNILDIFPYNDDFIIKPEKKRGFFLLENNQLKVFKTEADEFLEKNQYTKGAFLLNGNYAFGTNSGGIIVIDKMGAIINIIDQDNNLGKNNVIDLLVSRGSLIALHPNELSIIDPSPPYSYFSNTNGELGEVMSIIRHKGNMYIGSSLGVFVLMGKNNPSNCNSRFKKIQGAEFNCEKLVSYEGRLFALTAQGIFEIIGNTSLLLYKSNIYSYFISVREPGKIYVPLENKIGILKFADHKWGKEGEIPFPYLVENIVELRNNLLVTATGEGFFTMELTGVNDGEVGYKKYSLPDEISGDYARGNFYYTSNGLIFACSQGIFLIDERGGKGINLFSTIRIDKNSWIHQVVEDNNKNLWISYFSGTSLLSKIYLAEFDQQSGRVQLKEPFFHTIDGPIFNIYPENSGSVWIVGEEGIVKLSPIPEEKDGSTFNTLIRNIKLGGDSIIRQNIATPLLKETSVPKFSADIDKIRFEYSATDFLSKGNILYQHFLEGFDKGWSDWSKEPIAEYTHLPKGEYLFKLRAKNFFGTISSGPSYPFKILPYPYAAWWAYIVYSLVLAGLVLFIFRLRFSYLILERGKLESLVNKRTKELSLQKEKTENLLANMLPKTTASELIDTSKPDTKKFNMVTVLFSDIQGFTRISEEMNPEALIDQLDKFFLHFDSVVEKYNIEKIKTIGDAYMCAGGIPIKNRTNPVEVVLAAIEMQYYMKSIKNESISQIWGLRIGIDTGPVIAGVVGRKKISYDIWGTTVNTASRMESSGEVDKINITGNTFMLINDFFICQYRGKMPIKNKGEIDMYFVESIRPKLSVDLKGIEPDNDLKIQLQLLRLSDLEELVLTKLEEGLPKDLYYHNLKHTVDVYTQVELIGKSEGVSEEDILILRTAALLHDFGHTIDFDTHEEKGVMFAKQILPDFLYTEEQIEKISELIMATKMPPSPQTLLERIICDADLDYLGRIDFIPVSRNLFRELYERNKIGSELDWNNLQIKFIQNHQYFTKTARRLRDVNKNKQLENIRKLVDNE